MVATQPPILVVEDSPEEYEALNWAFRKLSISPSCFRCSDGDDALDYLNRDGKYKNLTEEDIPAIILLDLNLPGSDGREILKEIKEHQELRAIPVIILTTSSNPVDIETCYQRGANSYIIKPVSMEKFLETVQHINDYWFKAVTLKPKTDNVLV